MQTSKTQTSAISPQDIAKAAYYLWERAGRPPGREQEFWFRAESEFNVNHGTSTASAKSDSTSAARPAGVKSDGTVAGKRDSKPD
jgi:hypothetical protein